MIELMVYIDIALVFYLFMMRLGYLGFWLGSFLGIGTYWKFTEN